MTDHNTTDPSIDTETDETIDTEGHAARVRIVAPAGEDDTEGHGFRRP